MLTRREALKRLGLVSGLYSLGGFSGCRRTNRTRRVKIRNKLHNLAIATRNWSINYNNQMIPQAICDAEGNPLLSWRVLLLPELDGRSLFQQFRLEEPWDSKHNRNLIDPGFEPLSTPGEKRDGTTRLLMPLGTRTAFGEKWNSNQESETRRRITYEDIERADGLHQTIMFVEADKEHAIPWTKPDDIVINPRNPVEGLADHDGAFYVAFCDGSARGLSRDIGKETLNALFSWNGGENIDDDDY